jgi:hypothetical protein
VAAVAVSCAIVAPPSREAILRGIGRMMVVNEPIASADIIVITGDSGGAGVLEAADLVQAGVAKRVAVFADPPTDDDLEFVRRGLPYIDGAAQQIRQLQWLGITDVVELPSQVAGTGGEGRVLPSWCDQHRLQSIVIVTARSHSRRVRRLLGREMKGHATRIAVRPEHYSGFDQDRWWHTHDGMRTTIVELQKLALDLVLHPF